jgi:tetratricopeptide (TPR) repeat protein
VRAAIAALPAPARRAAELAAVAARDLDRAELSAVCPPDAVLGATECGLFRSADGRFGYRHALLREAVYADLDDAHRLGLHEALGLALTSYAAEAAHHLRLAGRADLAAGRLRQAAADAARATAFGEAAACLQEVVELAPEDAHAWLELAGAHALLGRRDEAVDALGEALRRLDPADGAARARAQLEAARWFRSSLCDPNRARQSSQEGLDALDARGLDEPALRAELLLIRAWSEVTVIGAGAADETLRRLEDLDIDLVAPSLRRQDLETVRGFVLLAQGRPDEAEAQLVRAGETGRRAGRPDMAYGGFANAACVAAATGDMQRALDHADRGAGIVAGLPVIELHMAALRAFLLARLGHHDEARAEVDRQAEMAARLGVPSLTATADHDAGLIALLAGEHERAQELLGRALAADAPIPRADAHLRRAEALARLGRGDEARAEIRAAALEPVRPGDRPGALVARMSFAQALAARALGEPEEAERRLREAAESWRRVAVDAGREHLASLVDLGRPPLTGVVDPTHELDRVLAELAELDALPT